MAGVNFRIGRAKTTAYSTSFASAENPISEGGAWTKTANAWQSVQTTGGNAIAAAYTENYDDAYAYLANWTSTNYEIIGTVYWPSGVAGEVELLVRVTDTTNSIQCYECLYNVGDGASAQFVRWNGAQSDFTVLTPVTDGTIGTTGNGNQIRATIVGTVLTFYWRASSADSWTQIYHYNSVNLATGKPGIGFYVHAADSNRTTVGLQDVTVTAL